MQRIYAARSSLALKRSLALMSFMPLATTTVVTLIGLAAIPRLAGLGSVEADPPTIIVHLARVDDAALIIAPPPPEDARRMRHGSRTGAARGV